MEKKETVECEHCHTVVLKEHATACTNKEWNLTWHYCLACDLGFTMAAARNAGVNVSITRDQVRFMCEALREKMMIEEE